MVLGTRRVLDYGFFGTFQIFTALGTGTGWWQPRSVPWFVTDICFLPYSNCIILDFGIFGLYLSVEHHKFENPKSEMLQIRISFQHHAGVQQVWNFGAFQMSDFQTWGAQPVQVIQAPEFCDCFFFSRAKFHKEQMEKCWLAINFLVDIYQTLNSVSGIVLRACKSINSIYPGLILPTPARTVILLAHFIDEEPEE